MQMQRAITAAGRIDLKLKTGFFMDSSFCQILLSTRSSGCAWYVKTHGMRGKDMDRHACVPLYHDCQEKDVKLILIFAEEEKLRYPEQKEDMKSGNPEYEDVMLPGTQKDAAFKTAPL